MIRRPPRSTHCISSAASDVYKRQSMIIGMEPDEESKTSKSKEDVLVDKLQSDMGSAVNVALSAATGMNVKLPLSFGGKSDSNKDSGSGGGLVSSLKKSFLNFCDD
eukprot:TRINITY_DN230_c0_g1_i6.p2 TRINITY_DN230_c0_g1~~TRINITY_DN230_c0_g1_i6.p2  ORF type:complete len:114 (-),score=33.27 TRINITY_DN230_c0_g1_i6:167-484(-)